MTLLLIKSVNNLLSFAKAITSYNSDLAITNAVNESLRNQILMLERQCWSNAQYSRRETLEISRIPDIDNGDLEGSVLTVLSKLDVNVDPANVEACQ